MSDDNISKIVIRHLGLQDYTRVWQKMQLFTQERTENTCDELWLVEHPKVFTLGQQGERGQIIQTHKIPIVQTDRGGHVTHHGPGQLVAYPLINLRRKNISVRPLVTLLENSLIALLGSYQIKAYALKHAPGVYADEKKIASIGLRIKKGCSYHGLALNVNMDLSPFDCINPCGMAGMRMVNMENWLSNVTVKEVTHQFIQHFSKELDYQINELSTTI